MCDQCGERIIEAFDHVRRYAFFMKRCGIGSITYVPIKFDMLSFVFCCTCDIL